MRRCLAPPSCKCGDWGKTDTVMLSIGHPTLRLIRVQIGGFLLGILPSGQWRVLTQNERDLVFRR